MRTIELSDDSYEKMLDLVRELALVDKRFGDPAPEVTEENAGYWVERVAEFAGRQAKRLEYEREEADRCWDEVMCDIARRDPTVDLRKLEAQRGYLEWMENRYLL